MTWGRSMRSQLIFCGWVIVAIGAANLGQASPACASDLLDQIDAAEFGAQWLSYQNEGAWQVHDGMLTASGDDDAVRLAPAGEAGDAVVEMRFKIGDSPRQCLGIALRARDDGQFLVVRYYDQQRLQILAYNAFVPQLAHQAPMPGVSPREWHRMKAAVIGDVVAAKVWKDGSDEPAWQIMAHISPRRPLPDDGREVAPEDWLNVARAEQARASIATTGKCGLVKHDTTSVTFDDVRVWTDGAAVERARTDVRQFIELEYGLSNRPMRLCLSATNELKHSASYGVLRRMDVSLEAGGWRTPIPLDGALEIESASFQESRAVAADDWKQGLYSLWIPAQHDAVELRATFTPKDAASLSVERTIPGLQVRPWREYAIECARTLVDECRDVYGERHTPCFMSIVDVKTLRAPAVPDLLDGFIRTEGRRHRRAEGGANLWNDQILLRTLYRISQLTNDPAYAQAADDYAAFVLKECRTGNNLPVWGSHIFYDAYADAAGGDVRDGGVHEILIRQALWDDLHRLDPQRVEDVVELIWERHIRDKKTGSHNRHDSEGTGDFAFSGGTFATAFCFMYQQTRDQEWLRRARLVTDRYWNARNPETNLAPTSPNSTLPRQFNGRHATTKLTGPFAAQLLQCYERTGDAAFRDQAIAFIKAYDKYGWDASAGMYWGTLKLDGVPLRDRSEFYNYVWAPAGHVDVWKTHVYSWEFPVSAAQAAVYAWEVSADEPANRDGELLAIAERWAQAIEAALPAQPGRRWKQELEAAMPELVKTSGTYAENYGRAISFFVHLHRATGKEAHRRRAEALAAEAVDKLYENGLFRGHPAKPYYDALDGSAFVMFALLELDATGPLERGAF